MKDNGEQWEPESTAWVGGGYKASERYRLGFGSVEEPTVLPFGL